MKIFDFFNSIRDKDSNGIQVPQQYIFKKFLKPIEAKAGEILHESGKICRVAIYIEKGVLRQYALTNSGVERTYQIAMEGEWVSDLESFIEQIPSNRNIEALEDSRIWVASHSSYIKAIKAMPFFDYFFSRFLKRITFKVQKQNAAILEMTLEERYEKLLNDKPEYFQRVPLYVIATYLGVEKQSLSRLRKRIQTKK
jgi:CRP-like cAMP-binding protein